MTDKDRAFEEWWTTSAPLQPMTPTAFNAGWDAHAELVKPLIEAGRKRLVQHFVRGRIGRAA